MKKEAHTNIPSSTNTFSLTKNGIEYKVCIEAKKTIKKRTYNILVYKADDPRDKNYITISPEVDLHQNELKTYLKSNLQILLTEKKMIRNLALIDSKKIFSAPKTT